ncbi:MAG: MerR family transcriptional regulator [Clostridium sartagoforme]|nr:MerR family transcriptional regulator [Clostridium sartagoforme]
MSRQRSIDKILESEYVTIGELVRITNSRYSTLKFYTEEGMLPFQQEEEKLTRRFKRVEAVKRIEEIKELKRQGYRVDEIKKILINE